MIRIRRNTWIRRRRLAMFGLKKTDRILDLGCGDGLDIEILRKKGCKKITGVDISPKLLADAKKRNPGVRFIRASAEKLPFKDASFDTVFVDSVLYHFVGKPEAFSEIWRVLVPGGRLCIIDMHNSRVRKFFDWLTFSPIRRIIPYLEKRRRAYTVEQAAIERWHAHEKEFLKSLASAGFKQELLRTDLLSIIGKYRKMQEFF